MDAEEVAAVSTVKFVFGLVGAVGGGIIAILTYGRKIGNFEQRLVEAEKTNVELVTALTKLREYHDADMKEVRAFFRNQDGDLKFLTPAAHYHLCEQNTKLMVQQYTAMNDLLRSQTAEIAKLSAEVNQLSTAVAVLQSMRVAWRPPPPKNDGDDK